MFEIIKVKFGTKEAKNFRQFVKFELFWRTRIQLNLKRMHWTIENAFYSNAKQLVIILTVYLKCKFSRIVVHWSAIIRWEKIIVWWEVVLCLWLFPFKAIPLDILCNLATTFVRYTFNTTSGTIRLKEYVFKSFIHSEVIRNTYYRIFITFVVSYYQVYDKTRYLAISEPYCRYIQVLSIDLTFIVR